MQPRELTIKTRYLELAALAWGNPDGRPVLALHGWLDNAASFIPLAEQMELENIHLIAVDLPGHGRSGHRPAGFSYDVWHYVEDLVDIAEALKLERFALTGHSLGGVICTMAAASALQEQIVAMILIDGISPTPRLPEQSPLSLKQYIQLRRTPVEQLPVSRYRSKKQAVRARAISQYKVSRESAELLVERAIMQKGEDWLWTADPRLKLSSPARFTREQSLAFIQAVACPAHVIYAESGEISGFINDIQEYADSFTFYPLAGSHHLHMDDQVHAVASIADTVLSQGVW